MTDKEQIADLQSRLKNALTMQTAAENQEVAKLREDLAIALESEYRFYTEAKAAPMDADMYAAYKLSLSRIFQRLSRLGVEFKEEG
jgi:hypothetical protein